MSASPFFAPESSPGLDELDESAGGCLFAVTWFGPAETLPGGYRIEHVVRGLAPGHVARSSDLFDDAPQRN